MTKKKKEKGANRPPVVSPLPGDDTVSDTSTPAAAVPAEGQSIAEILAAPNTDTGNESAALEALQAAENVAGPAGEPEPFYSEPSPARQAQPEPAPVRRGRGRPPGSRTTRQDEPSRAGTDRRSKAELAARLAELEKENAGLRPSDGQAIEQAKSALAVTFKVVGVMLSQWRGSHWQFNDDETKALAEGWAPPLAPYLVHSGEALKWVAALGVTWTVVAPRLAKDREASPIELGPGIEVNTVAQNP